MSQIRAVIGEGVGFNQALKCQAFFSVHSFVSLGKAEPDKSDIQHSNSPENPTIWLLPR